MAMELDIRVLRGQTARSLLQGIATDLVVVQEAQDAVIERFERVVQLQSQLGRGGIPGLADPFEPDAPVRGAVNGSGRSYLGKDALGDPKAGGWQTLAELLRQDIQTTADGLKEVRDAIAKVRPNASGKDATRPAPPPRPPRFLSGANQTLRRIEEQRKRLSQVSDPAEREAIEKDLKQREFNARRSIYLGEQRQARGDAALQAPGLLELFGDLHSLLRGGGAGVLSKHIGAGIQMVLSEKPGGLNVGQKLAQSVGNSARPAATAQKAASAASSGADAAGDAAGAGMTWGTGGGLLAGAAFVGGLAAGALTLKFFVDQVKSAGEHIHEFGQARSFSGGSAADVAQFRVFGFDPLAGAGAANQFRAGLQNPLAQQARAQLGLGYVSSSPYASQNNARILNETLEALATITDAEKQLRLARMLGLDAYVDELRISPRIREARRQQAEAMKEMFGASTEQDARDFMALLKDIGTEFSDLSTAIGGPLLHDVDSLLEVFRGMLSDTLPEAQQLGQFVRAMFDEWMEHVIRLSSYAQHILNPVQNLKDLAKHPGNPFGAYVEAEKEAQGGIAAYRSLPAAQAAIDAAIRAQGKLKPKGRGNPDDAFGTPDSFRSGGKPVGADDGEDHSAKRAEESSKAAAQTATMENARATRELTSEIRALRYGQFGGGSRARGVVSDGFGGSLAPSASRRESELQAFALGYWGTGAA